MADERNGAQAANDGTIMPMVPEALGVDPVLLALLHVASLLDFAKADVEMADRRRGFAQNEGVVPGRAEEHERVGPAARSSVEAQAVRNVNGHRAEVCKDRKNPPC